MVSHTHTQKFNPKEGRRGKREQEQLGEKLAK